MTFCIDQIYYRSTKKREAEINAIYFPYNGMMEHIIVDSMPFNLYSSKETSIYEWRCNDWNDKIIYFDDFYQISDKYIDIIITHYNGKNDISQIVDLSKSIYCPLIIINHTNNDLKIKNGIVVDFYDNILGLKTQAVNKTIDILLCGDYSYEDQNIVRAIQNQFSDIVSVGYNYNSYEYQTYDELLQYIASSKVCISANSSMGAPTISLLAASYGSAVVTNETTVTSNIFTNNKNAILFNDIYDIKNIVDELLYDSEKMDSINNKSKKLINKKFNQEISKNNWLSTYNNVKDMVIKI